MKKIAFTLNTMALFLPVLDCVEWLCTVHVYRGMKRVLCFVKVFKRRIKEAQLLRNVPSNSYLQAASKGKSLDVGSLELRAIFAKKLPRVLGFFKELVS